MRRLVLITLLAAACGSKQSKPAEHDHAAMPEGHEMHEGGEHGEMGEMEAMPPALSAFHDRMAPLWHAEPGGERTRNTCAAAPDLVQFADDVRSAATPAGVDEKAWAAKAVDLRDAVAKLATDCTQSQGASIDTTFPPVHMAFHALLEMLPEAKP